MPTDGEPVIGPPAGTEGLYIAVMHSAITLAAAVGRLAASEILTARPAPELAGCRPARFRRRHASRLKVGCGAASSGGDVPTVGESTRGFVTIEYESFKRAIF